MSRTLSPSCAVVMTLVLALAAGCGDDDPPAVTQAPQATPPAAPDAPKAPRTRVHSA